MSSKFGKRYWKRKKSGARGELNYLRPRKDGHPGVSVTLTPEGMWIESGRGLKTVTFGDTEIARPKVSSLAANRNDAEANLRKTYSPGRYTEPAKIKEILNSHGSFFENRLRKSLEALASHGFLHYLFNQYDQLKRIEILHSEGGLNEQEVELWQDCIYTKRAIKFLCERVVLLKPKYNCRAAENQIPEIFDEAIICAEQLVKLSICSDEVHMMRPGETVLTISEPGEEVYWEVGLSDAKLASLVGREFWERVNKDAAIRRQYCGQAPFDQDWKKQDEIIGDDFERIFGVRYSTAMQTLSILPRMSRPGDFGCCSIPKDNLIRGVAANMSITKECAEKLLSGFLLTAENMKKEARHYWNPKVSYRAFRRGIFEIEESAESSYTWSDSMYKESWLMFLISVAYGILPPEWRDPGLTKAMGNLKKACGNWFERITCENLRSIGVEAIHSRTGFGQGKQRIECPHGEIDLIAYLAEENLLVIGECKMTLAGSEPKFFRDELEDFVRKEKSYAAKFRKKIDWAKEHISELSAGLDSSHEFSVPVKIDNVAPVMVTFLPSIASYFIPDFPCVALSELITEYFNMYSVPSIVGHAKGLGITDVLRPTGPNQFERDPNSIQFPRLFTLLRAVSLIMRYGFFLGGHFNHDTGKFAKLQVDYETALKGFGIELEEIRIKFR